MDVAIMDELQETERPPFQRKLLPPRLYSAPDGKYSVGVNSLTVFSLETMHSWFSQDDEEEEAHDIPSSQTVPGTSNGQTLTPIAFWMSGCDGAVPKNAVRVSFDLDGGALYVGRVVLLGDLLPGKVAERHHVCYVAHEGKEISFRDYEVLVLERGRIEWIPCRDGAFPAHALPCGLTLQGVTIFSARASVSGIMTPGMLVSGESKCRISYDMKEFTFPEYEILTVRSLNPSEFNGATRFVPRLEDSNHPDSSQQQRMESDNEI